MKSIPIILMPQVTIEALIKKLNNDYTIKGEEMASFLAEYRRLNGNQVFSPGTQVKIPIRG